MFGVSAAVRGIGHHHAEETALSDFPFALCALSPIHGPVDVVIKQRTLAVDAVECARLDQAFHHTLVDGPQIHAFAEIEKRLERLAGDDRNDGVLSDVLDCRQAETNPGGRWREVHIAVVDIRRQNGNAHLTAFVDVLDDLFLTPALTGQNRGQEVIADSVLSDMPFDRRARHTPRHATC